MTIAATSTPQLSVAAAHLLNAARASGRSVFDDADLEVLLHQDLRYTHRGPDAKSVSPGQALDELADRAIVVGDQDGWWLR